MSDLNIEINKIFAEEDLSKIVEDIIDKLKIQFHSKNEIFELPEIITGDLSKLNETKIYIGRLSDKNADKLLDKKIIVVFENKLDASVFKYFLTHEIVGIFRKDRLEIEYEEKGKLEKLLKDIIREMNYKVISQKDKRYIQQIPYKEITNWKFQIDSKNPVVVYQDSKYVSIFLDTSMREFSKRLRKIINDFKSCFQKYLMDDASENKEENCRKSSKNKTLKDLEKEMNKCYNKLLNEMGTIRFPSLLMEGETGTGKSLIADIIANEVFGSEYVDDFYRKYSINNVPKELIGSSLFGHEKGAYTQAESERIGHILESRFGILFLDEIAEIPPDVQAKLLVYMDDYMVRPIGYSGPGIFCPVMIISATNKDLKQGIEKGEFRIDLYHRFKYKIKIPALRERKEDIRFLINFVLLNPNINPFEKNNGYLIKKISFEAIQKLENYHYPGNFRELEGILKQAVNLALTDGLDIILDKHIII